MTTNPNLFAGEWVQGVNTAAILGGDSVAAGLWRVEEGFDDKAIIKKFDYTSRLAAGNLCNATPGESGAMSDMEVQLTTFSIVDKVCKHDFDNTSYAAFSNRGVFNKQIPTEVLQAYVETMAGSERENLENLRWSGDVTSLNPLLALQDGVIAQLVAAGTFIPAPGTVTDPTSAATVLADLALILSAVPAKIRTAAGFKMIISPEVFAALEQALIVNGAVYNGFNANMMGNGQPLSYVGTLPGTTVPVYVANGLSIGYPQAVLCGVFTNGIKGNLVLVTDALSDSATIVIQDRQTVFASEPFVDITWSFRQGVAVARPEEVVLYI